MSLNASEITLGSLYSRSSHQWPNGFFPQSALGGGGGFSSPLLHGDDVPGICVQTAVPSRVIVPPTPIDLEVPRIGASKGSPFPTPSTIVVITLKVLQSVVCDPLPLPLKLSQGSLAGSAT